MPFTSVLSNLSPLAIKGMAYDNTWVDGDSFVNGEVSAEIPFGVFVKQGTDVKEILKLTAITEKVVGVTLYKDVYQKDVQLGTTGVKIDNVMCVAPRGRLWMWAEEAVIPTDPVMIRAIAAGSEVAGDVRTSADASDLIDARHFARFITSTTAAGLVVVEFDLAARTKAA